MRKIALRLLQYKLKVLVLMTLRRYKPHVIGVTGSVGKTLAKTAIYTVLSKATDKRVRASGGNLNNELGMPLAVLGDYKTSGGALFWIGVLIKSTLRLIFVWSKKNYPDILVLEYGADKPGDIGKLVDIVKPNIAVITAVGKVPVHVEFYDSPEEVAKEKSSLINSLGAGSTAILNIDDPAVFDMRENARTEVTTYGFDSGADVRISGFKNETRDGKPYGISFRLSIDDSTALVKIDGVFGKSQAYAAGAAAAVGVTEGMKLIEIAETLPLHKGEKGRTRLIPGVKNSLIIDDTYNASPASGEAALDIIDDLKADRKIAVLGDMLELGEYTEDAHTTLGEHASRVADYIVTVGARAEFIAEGAIKAGFPENRIQRFGSSEEAGPPIQGLIKEGDLVLVKASQGIRTEKIVKEIMAEPNRAKDLLVRQYGKWLKN